MSNDRDWSGTHPGAPWETATTRSPLDDLNDALEAMRVDGERRAEIAREHADHERRMAEALQSAIAGTHRFVVVDMDAPMRTCEPIAGGKTRLSPDVWRRLTRWLGPVLSLPVPYVEQPIGRLTVDGSVVARRGRWGR